VTAAAAIGLSLHVCGSDPHALDAAIAPFLKDGNIVWERAEPTLEDVFIHFMSLASDNAEAA